MNTFLQNGVKAAILTAFAMALGPAAAQAAPHLSRTAFDLSGHGDAQIIQIRGGHGADDGAGHDGNDDNGGGRGGRGRGADDAPGDDNGGRNGGRGRGADDAPGDDNGGRNGGRGRGRDDGPDHT
ncbi:hypothetical protein BOO69_02805 [Sulfitobacter alexandrii]|uniref:Uncharacterized protein n=1 Tax=Sulfitobacter alexandrii TaxID=1917485 RepID=A0A1J0WDS8_9RHOB|nr:hypothetical protein [Sulfitobacter alexandrii]APE42466.1 hypothetical protein BOO69_02805 [Sulfitobacter alexandrii]